MTGDCGDVVTSLGAWALWQAQRTGALQARVDAVCDVVWGGDRRQRARTAPRPRPRGNPVTALRIWWHRRVLGHRQVIVMNGETEPGVQCYLPMNWTCGLRVPCTRGWFPSDGGRGR